MMTITFDPELSETVEGLKETVEMCQAYVRAIVGNLTMLDHEVKPGSTVTSIDETRTDATLLAELLDYLEETVDGLGVPDQEEDDEEDTQEDSEEDDEEDDSDEDE